MRKMIWQMMFFALSVLVMTGCNLVTYEENETLSISTDGITEFRVNQDEGDVSIIGEEGLEEIEVNATYSVVGEDMDEARIFKQNHTMIRLEGEGATAHLTTSIKRGSQKEQGNIHIDIRVPADISLVFSQNEGELTIQNLQNEMTLQHGTGGINLVNISGQIQLTDGAGNITAERLNGSTSITNNNGTLIVNDSKGELSILSGAGDVQVQEFKGPVTIRSGSGDVDIQAIDGDVTITGNSGGKLTIADVAGTIIEP
ncbi:DUF4097 family beta strand repeat-containing protein [Bacillus solitudinis]|uniref:DUF4097 family beta strand repeat protein n=1 Tax=Bacillus solitudinis TaxID=2014074 RepID=UPI000C234F3B|nr:DUF4097 family beta strand repeat protein [Bacillus solitudinis]